MKKLKEILIHLIKKVYHQEPLDYSVLIEQPFLFKTILKQKINLKILAYNKHQAKIIAKKIIDDFNKKNGSCFFIIESKGDQYKTTNSLSLSFDELIDKNIFETYTDLENYFEFNFINDNPPLNSKELYARN